MFHKSKESDEKLVLIICQTMGGAWPRTSLRQKRWLVTFSYCTDYKGYHKVTEVAKTANTAKMFEKCMNYMNALFAPPHKNPMELGPGNIFEKNKRCMILDPKIKKSIVKHF